LRRLTAPLAEANALNTTQISEIQSLTTALKEANTKAAALTTQLDEEHHFNNTFLKWKRTDWYEWEGFLAYPGRIESFQFFPDSVTMMKYIEHCKGCEEECKKIFPEGFFGHQSPPPLSTAQLAEIDARRKSDQRKSKLHHFTIGFQKPGI
jgi:hypothetical protein